MPRQLQPCGTEAAYHRHRNHGEKACGPCRRAHTEYIRAWRRASRPACGTVAAYRAHRERHEDVCPACRTAWNTYQRARYAARKGA